MGIRDSVGIYLFVLFDILFIAFSHFSWGYSVVFPEHAYKISCMGIAYHPCHIAGSIFSCKQQFFSGFHSFFSNIFVDRTAKAVTKAFCQAFFTDCCPLGNLRNRKRMCEIVVNKFAGLQQCFILSVCNCKTQNITWRLTDHFFAKNLSLIHILDELPIRE